MQQQQAGCSKCLRWPRVVDLLQYHSRVMSLRNLPLNDVPMDLEPELRRMLSTDPVARPTASDFAGKLSPSLSSPLPLTSTASTQSIWLHLQLQFVPCMILLGSYSLALLSESHD